MNRSLRRKWDGEDVKEVSKQSREDGSFHKTEESENFIWNQRARKGSSNDVILGDIYHMELDEKTPTVILIQLTGLERIARDELGQSPTLRSMYESLKFNWLGMPNEDEVSVEWEEYFKNEYTPESHLMRLFGNIIGLQERFEKMPNVDYKIFLGWDIFTAKSGDGSSMWDLEKPYTNWDNKLLVEEYLEPDPDTGLAPQAGWGSIDFEKFLFAEVEGRVKFGGMMQWIQHALPPQHWYREPENQDYHPSEHAHEEFGEQIMVPVVEKMFAGLEGSG